MPIEELHLDKILKFFIKTLSALFSVVNPLGVMPIFMALTKGHGWQYQKSMSKKAAFYMTLILAFFLFAGTYLMSFFGISLEAMRIAGGIIVLRSGFLLLNARESNSISKKSQKEALEKIDISLTPLALPLLSGPGAIATTISFATHATRPYRFVILGAIIILGAISYLCMATSGKLMPLLGKAGLESITKIMGFLSMCVGAQFIMNGIHSFVVNEFLSKI